MPRLPFSAIGDTPNQRIIGHNPEILTAFKYIMDAVFNKNSLDSGLLEQVRRTLAWGFGCRV
jgi:hypothetical protein